MQIKFISNSLEDTRKLALTIAGALFAGSVISLNGDLGAGKTTFTRGIAVGLGLGDNVTSPTFALVNEYHGDKLSLYHFDMYRICSEEDLETTGFYDYPFEENVAAVEWSENIAEFLPKHTIYITINRLSESEREIIIEDGGRFAAAWN